jgi:hypothetical protein
MQTMQKIVRSICLFSDQTSEQEFAMQDSLAQLLRFNHFAIQTQRICLPSYQTPINEKEIADRGILIGCGALSWQEFQKNFPRFTASKIRNITLDLTNESICLEHIDPLFSMIERLPSNTFAFAFSFNLPHSSPFFPSATFEKKGFSIGLQATDLSEGCSDLDQWFSSMKTAWDEVDSLMQPFEGYLGIDSSIAPLFSGKSSFVNLIRRMNGDFSRTATTDFFTRISSFIKKQNPRPVGLCGLMFPCLEDFELAEEYEKGNFSIERNIFLSLHSGLGIDTYPIGIDQDRETVVEIARLIQQLSNKYQKPLAIRFVSDGKAKIGEQLNLANQYLKDVIVRPL